MKLELKWCHTGLSEKVILPLLPLKKILALSLPLSLLSAALFGALGSVGPPAVQAATERSDIESPAMLRLTALDTLMRGEKKNALELYDEAIRLASRQFGEESTFLGDLYYEAGRLYLDMDQFTQAEDYLNHAIKINPKNASARLSLAKLLDLREKVQESLGQTREALMATPSSPVARFRFVQTLSKYGQKPSDKAIATQESLTIAMMQKLARLNLTKPAPDKTASPKKSGKKGGEPSHPVPTLPKNLTPLKGDEAKAEAEAMKDEAARVFGGDTKGGGAAAGKANAEAAKAGSDTKAGAGNNNGASESSKKSSAALSLFPLQGLSERKKQDELKKQQAKQDELRKQAELQEQARRKAEDAQKRAREADLVERIKEQARKREKAKAEKAAQSAPPAHSAKDDKATAGKSKADPGKAATPAQKAQPAQQTQQIQQIPVQQIQQMPVQPMQPGFFMQPPMAFPAANSAPPKGKKAGFVPPPPPTMNMYPGVPQMVVPQAVPQPQPKPAVEKPKVEKPKAAPKEEKQVEDKPPPMTSTGEQADPDFILDWADLSKNKGQKKKGK